VHQTFNIAVLETYRETNLENEIEQIEPDNKGLMKETLIAGSPLNNDNSRHLYLVQWEGCPHEENTSERFETVINNVKESLEEYYKENPDMEKDKRFGKKK